MRCAMVLACLLALGLGGCSKKGIPVGPAFNRIAWEPPIGEDQVLRGPIYAELLNEGTLLYLYSRGTENGGRESAVCLIGIPDGECRSLRFPHGVLLARVPPDEIAIRPTFGAEENAPTLFFVEAATLTELERPEIPDGRYFHFRGVDAVLAGKRQSDIWFYDRGRKMETRLPVSKHGLDETVEVALAPGRVIVTGWKDSEDFSRPRTQLWSFPELKKIAEYQASGQWPWGATPEVFGDLFAFPLAPGVWQVASIRDGELRFVVGRALPRGGATDDGSGILLCEDTEGYVEETGVILCVEQTAEDELTLNAYDCLTGQNVRRARLKGQTLDGFEMQTTKAGNEWVLFEQLRDRSDDPDEGQCRMQLVPYRIRDFKVARRWIKVDWGCFLKPIIDRGRIIVPMNDHALVGDLSPVIEFGD